jgi:hypothetical protein
MTVTPDLMLLLTHLFLGPNMGIRSPWYWDIFIWGA